MAGTDYYGVLGVPRGASDKDIKNAFRRLARQHHPDVNPGNADAESRFKAINQAHEVLGDSDSRRKYDRYGENWMHADQIENMNRQGGFRAGHVGMGGVEFGGGGFEDILGRMFGRGRPRPAPTPPRDTPVEITLSEAYKGTRHTVSIPRDGGGRRRLEVDIPAGVDTGSRVRVGGTRRQPDLYLTITVRPDPMFRRTGANLTTDVPITLFDAVLGGEAQVPTMKGSRLALRIPPETQNGQTFRLAGQGMPRMRGSGHGDLYAKVNVMLPTGLNEDERGLFEQLRANGDDRGTTA